MTRDVVILDGARTAIGTFGGALAGTPPTQTAAHVARAALARSGVEGPAIGHVVFGHVINTEPRDMYLSRVAAIEAGIPDTAPAMNVNRRCGAGTGALPTKNGGVFPLRPPTPGWRGVAAAPARPACPAAAARDRPAPARRRRYARGGWRSSR